MKSGVIVGIFLLFVFSIANVMAADGDFLWAAVNGTASSDIGNVVTSDSQGNVIIGSALGGAIFIKKYSSSGLILWSYQSATGAVSGITTDSSGNIYVTGSYTAGSFDTSLGGTCLLPPSAGGFSDIFVAKYSSNGDCIWSKGFESGYYGQSGYGIALDNSGNVVVIGYFGGSVNFGSVSEPHVFSTIGIGSDIFIEKMSGVDGSYIWAKQFGSNSGGSQDEIGRSVAIDSANNIYVTGEFLETASFDGTPVLTSTGNKDAFVLKISPSGNLILAKKYGGSIIDEGASIDVDSNGNILLIGSFYQTTNLGGNCPSPLPASSSSRVFVSKLNQSADCLWVKYYSDMPILDQSSRFWGSGVFDSLGNSLVTGSFVGTIDFGNGPKTTNGLDSFLVKYNQTGGLVYAKFIGNKSGINDQGKGIAVDNNGNVLVTGGWFGTEDFGDGVLRTAVGLYDIFVTKQSGTTIQVQQNNNHQSDSNQNFKINSTEISVYNSCWQTPGCVISGRGVSSLNVTNANSIWQASGLGCYQYNPSCSPSCWTSIPTC